MIRRPPRSTRTDTRFPYTTLFRSHAEPAAHPLKLAPAHAGHVLAVHQYAAFIHLHQAQDALQHHRLAGAGPADHDKRFARIDAEVDSIQHGLAAKALDHALKRDLWPGTGVAVVHQPNALRVRKWLDSSISPKSDTHDLGVGRQ